MALRLAKDILHFLREQAAPTSLRRLQREGIKTVTVIDMDAIEDLVSRAVDRVLREADIDPAQTARLGRDAREEFLRLLEERQSLRDSLDTLDRERQALSENLDRLHSALNEAERDLRDQRREAAAADREEKSREVIADPDLDSLSHVFSGVIEQRLGHLPADVQTQLRAMLADFPLKLAEQAKGYVHRETERAREEERLARQDRIEGLERRVGKLKRALTDTEEMLERVKAAKEIDSGVASIYDSAQGLSTQENEYEKKKGLLSEIFRLNMELNSLIAEQKQETGA